MILEIFGFLNMSLADILDILMVAAIIFLLFRWIKGSSAMNIFVAILMLFVIRVMAESLNMKLMAAILKTLLDVGIIALIVIFQPEVRHFLIRLGSRSGLSIRTRKILDRILGLQETSIGGESIKEIAEACWAMGQEKTGALIVLPADNPLEQIIETGDRIDALVRRRLIMNIFFKNSPLHDGAMIIKGDRIVAARCTLPITGRSDIPPSLGMRHKAAIGISEESDASVIVVSEETGRISYVRGGVVTRIENMNELILLLTPSHAKEDDAKNEDDTE